MFVLRNAKAHQIKQEKSNSCLMPAQIRPNEDHLDVLTTLIEAYEEQQ